MLKKYVAPEYEVVKFTKDDLFLTASPECGCYDPTDVVCDDCKFDN